MLKHIEFISSVADSLQAGLCEKKSQNCPFSQSFANKSLRIIYTSLYLLHKTSINKPIPNL
jgi:hypothetical protein